MNSENRGSSDLSLCSSVGLTMESLSDVTDNSSTMMLKGQPHAVSLYDFETGIDGDLSFKAGEILILDEVVDQSWYFGRALLTGNSGIFPMNFVQVRIPLESGLYTHTQPQVPLIASNGSLRSIQHPVLMKIQQNGSLPHSPSEQEALPKRPPRIRVSSLSAKFENQPRFSSPSQPYARHQSRQRFLTPDSSTISGTTIPPSSAQTVVSILRPPSGVSVSQLTQKLEQSGIALNRVKNLPPGAKSLFPTTNRPFHSMEAPQTVSPLCSSPQKVQLPKLAKSHLLEHIPITRVNSVERRFGIRNKPPILAVEPTVSSNPEINRPTGTPNLHNTTSSVQPLPDHPTTRITFNPPSKSHALHLSPRSPRLLYKPDMKQSPIKTNGTGDPKSNGTTTLVRPKTPDDCQQVLTDPYLTESECTQPTIRGFDGSTTVSGYSSSIPWTDSGEQTNGSSLPDEKTARLTTPKTAVIPGSYLGPKSVTEPEKTRHHSPIKDQCGDSASRRQELSNVKDQWLLVLHDFDGEEPGDLTLKSGNVIRCLDTLPPTSADEEDWTIPERWLHCVTWFNVEGQVPSTYVRRFMNTPELTRWMQNRPRAEAIFEFNAEKPGDMTLMVGDIIYLYEAVDANWFRGENSITGKRGIFPSPFVRVICPLLP